MSFASRRRLTASLGGPSETFRGPLAAKTDKTDLAAIIRATINGPGLIEQRPAVRLALAKAWQRGPTLFELPDVTENSESAAEFLLASRIGRR